MNTYVRTPLVLTKGKGSRVWDVEGREYLDLFPGWGVSGLGYNHPWVTKAVRGQSMRIMHVSNNFYHPLQAKAAKALVELAFDPSTRSSAKAEGTSLGMSPHARRGVVLSERSESKDDGSGARSLSGGLHGKVFFTNSGAEAVETAIKLARRWGQGRHEIIVMERSFHGRTMGALSATGQTKYQEGFEPLLPSFIPVSFNDVDAARRALTSRSCAILVEPIQGEGGVRVADHAVLKGLRQLCDEQQLLLIFDEIQTGMGRTGSWFGYQHSGVVPDVLLLAKTLGGGFPIGAVIARREVADLLTPGTHATTYGGNPLGCACILAVIEAINKQELLDRVNTLSPHLFKRLDALKQRAPIIREVRGRGFLVGIELTIEGTPIVDACRSKRLLINCTQGNVLRLLPAMTITRAQLDRALMILEETIMELSQ